MGRREREVKFRTLSGEMLTLALSDAEYLESRKKGQIIGRVAANPESMEQVKTRERVRKL